MIAYAVRAVAWLPVCVAAVIIVVMMEIVARWAWSAWPLAGVAVGLLAAAAAWCCDEPAADVVDVSPRSLAWRTVARGAGILVLLAAWVLAVIRGWDGLFGHPRVMLLQGMVALVGGVAWATWRRAHGYPRPGLTVSLYVVPFVTGWALIRPFEESIPVFPYADSGFGDWGVSAAGWSVAGCAFVILLVAALADAPWWQVRRIDAPSELADPRLVSSDP